MAGVLYIVATPIGNLGDFSFRAKETLEKVDMIYCEDTRRTRKLLTAYEVSKPLKSCPYFKERQGAEEIVSRLQEGNNIAYVTDAGVPALSDPGAFVVEAVRKANLQVEVIGGTSALTHFLAGCGLELESFRFIGFLPEKKSRREVLFKTEFSEPTIFFESCHRMEKTLQLLGSQLPEMQVVLAKELSKISERFFYGTAEQLLQEIPSYKGEWIGLFLPTDKKGKK